MSKNAARSLALSPRTVSARMTDLDLAVLNMAEVRKLNRVYRRCNRRATLASLEARYN